MSTPPPRLTGSPLDRLTAWHRLGERQVEALRLLLQQPGQAGVAEAVLRYFDRTETVHHRDEEDDLFPALLESMAGSDPVCLRELAESATAAHRALEAAWHALRPAVVALARSQPATLASAGVDALDECCRASFALEDREIIPTAARLLDDATLAQLGRRFDERRASRA